MDGFAFRGVREEGDFVILAIVAIALVRTLDAGVKALAVLLLAAALPAVASLGKGSPNTFA